MARLADVFGIGPETSITLDLATTTLKFHGCIGYSVDSLIIALGALVFKATLAFDAV
jgi:hypothetical protein